MKKIFGVIFGIVLITILLYLVVFGRTINQPENHIGIALALPKVILSSEAVRIDDKTYLARSLPSFIRAMEQQGFTYVEQFGSGHLFRKDGNNCFSISSMYSSYFMTFTYPQKN